MKRLTGIRGIDQIGDGGPSQHLVDYPSQHPPEGLDGAAVQMHALIAGAVVGAAETGLEKLAAQCVEGVTDTDLLGGTSEDKAAAAPPHTLDQTALSEGGHELADVGNGKTLLFGNRCHG